MTEKYTLYVVPFSLYSGKARSYLIKQGIPYREMAPKSEHYRSKVLPVVHRMIMPTIELPGDEYIQDSTVIIEYFENQPGIVSALPDTPKQKIIALLFDVIGSDGLLRPAMHYRWNFKEDNDDFLEQSFCTMVPPGIGDPLPHARKGMDRMREAAVAFGIKPDSIPVIETAYLELLGLLDDHFRQIPYLLGGRPSIGDFGLIAPFYGHLSRDPYPSMMMKKRALRVFRWTERMNRPGLDIGEYDDCSGTFLEGDEIPETLKPVLKLLSEDLVPETMAAAEEINQFLEKTNPEPGTQIARGTGLGEFEFRGIRIQALAQPYRFFLLARMQKAFDNLDESGREEVRTLFNELGLSQLLSIKLKRAVTRHDHLEVWE